jgi:hypothetical protein
VKVALKTGHGSHEHMVFTAVGTGIVDLEAVCTAARAGGAQWGTVEQDRMRALSPWESVTCSFLDLKARGWAWRLPEGWRRTRAAGVGSSPVAADAGRGHVEPV